MALHENHPVFRIAAYLQKGGISISVLEYKAEKRGNTYKLFTEFRNKVIKFSKLGKVDSQTMPTTPSAFVYVDSEADIDGAIEAVKNSCIRKANGALAHAKELVANANGEVTIRRRKEDE